LESGAGAPGVKLQRVVRRAQRGSLRRKIFGVEEGSFWRRLADVGDFPWIKRFSKRRRRFLQLATSHGPGSGQPKKYPAVHFGDVVQGVARAGAKQRVRGRAPKRHARASSFVGKLQQPKKITASVKNQATVKKSNNIA